MIVNRARRVAETLGLAGFSNELAPLARGQAISSVGSGLWFTVWALYLTREVHLSLSQAGIALSLAGLVGFISPIPLGRLADRRGPREIYRLLLCVEAIASLGFAVCSNLWQVTIVASAIAACSQGGVGVSAALITQLAADEDQIDVLARMRACSHAGQALGAALGAVVLITDARAGYLAAIILNAATFLLFAVDLSRVPSVPARPAVLVRARFGALRDIPFTTLAGICGVLCLCWGLMSSGLPLWIADDTHAPHAISAAIVFASTVAIALLQTAFSRDYNAPAAAARAALRSGFGLAACCLLLALAAGPPALAASGLLILAGAAHILGELWFVAASRGFSVPLMDVTHPAECQSVFAAGEALAIMLAPALMTAIVIPNHTAGWCGLALLFILAAIAAQPATRWATTTRQPLPAASKPQLRA
ncbi:MAG: MFS transporter [Solirubrobacteraceae bacterium]